MQNTSALYQAIISGDHWKEAKVVIDGTTYGMDTISFLTIQRAAFGSGTPTIGLAAAGTLSMALRNIPRYSIQRMAKIEPFVRVCNKTQQSEWLPKGIFWVDSRTISDDYIEVTAYDAMMKGEQLLDMSDIEWPLTDIELMEMIVEQALFPSDDPNYNVLDYIDSRTYRLMTRGFTIPVPAPDEFTCREMLANIAALYGGSYIINDLGKLQLICLWDRPEETYYLLIDPEGTGRVLIGGDRIILT